MNGIASLIMELRRQGCKCWGGSQTRSINNTADISNTTYYIAKSGALVFASGSIYWSAALDSYRFATDPKCAGKSAAIPGIQKLMTNVMRALVIDHPFNN